LFILVVEGLSRALAEARRSSTFHGVSFGNLVKLTHILFVDDVLIFCRCATIDCITLKNIVSLFNAAMSMIINENKLAIYLPKCNEYFKALFSNMFPFAIKEIGEGLKYLGFTIKPNKYGKEDWAWLVSKVERKVYHWCN
jgi:hypothetical protein